MWTLKRRSWSREGELPSIKKEDQQFFDQVREVVSVDLVMQVLARMHEDKVSGREDNVVSEMIKHLPLENFTCLLRVSRHDSWAARKLPARGRL